MEANNFHIRGLIDYNITGKFQRFPDASKYKRSKDLFVVLHDHDRGATFGHWKYQEEWVTYWNKNYESPGLEKLKETKRQLQNTKALQDYNRHKCEWRARELFLKYYAKHLPSFHPYVVTKRIHPYYAKQVRSWLLVPISNIDNELVTLQIIKPDGFKRLWKGTSHKELMIWLWDKLPNDYSGVIRICEGYATGCTIRTITKSPVVCSINSSNLPATCVAIRRKFIHAKIIICADNDCWGDDNAGIKVAKLGAKYTNAKIYYPIFDCLLSIKKPTDFNDLYDLYGYKEARRQLLIARN